MKTKILFLMLIMCSMASWGQIFTNTITGTNPNTSNPYTAGQVFNANITVSGIGRGIGITGTNSNNRYNAQSWNLVTIDINDYFEFTLTPNAGFKIDFLNFVYTGQRSNMGPVNFSFRSSVDSYVANIGTPSDTGATISLNLAAYQNITSPVTFRFYGWGGTDASGTFSINDFIFNATVSCGATTTWNGTMWNNSAPNTTTSAIINGNYNTFTNGDFTACSLVINATFSLVVEANNYIEIENDITNNGTLDVLNNGSIVQISNTATNTGNIAMSRIAKIRLLDYVYWSSPVASFPLTSISAATPANYFWKWNANIANPNGGEGNWESASGNMLVGTGYIVRGPNAWNTTTPTDYTATFAGIPNNGIYAPLVNRGGITAPLTTGTNGVVYTNFADNWNLVGNPYPSAIDAKAFLSLSPQNDIIEGSVRMWTHGNLPSALYTVPFYNTFTSNYNPLDYITYNETGASTQNGFNGKIGAGQSFFVVMNDGSPLISTVTFNNAMRSKLYDNSQFYRNSIDNKKATENSEKNRIWLDIVAPNGEVARTLVGYVQGATAAKDRMYDAYSSYKPELNIFSLIGEEIMTIQGKGLPFENTDIVSIGIKVPTNGTYTIAINAVDGLFVNNAQTIYLEDKALNSIHNLSISPYTFDGIQGVTNNRFVLRYTDAALSNTNFVALDNSVSVFSSNNSIKINSNIENIKSYTVYDVLGRILISNNSLNAKQSEINSLLKNNQALIVKVTLQNDQVISKKIVF